MLEPVDFLGNPVEVGDLVAVPRGNSDIELARVERIKFSVRQPHSYNLIEVPQHAAELYTIAVRPIKSTTAIKWEDKERPGQRVGETTRHLNPDRYQPKLRWIASKDVKNFINVSRVNGSS